MDQQKINKTIKTWKDFADRQRRPEEIKINDDSKRVRLLAEGVLSNEDNHGFKYCPCRLISKDPVTDAKLICPCNFKNQKTWQEKGECWCSLFVKKSK